jgi:hypothetical protein
MERDMQFFVPMPLNFFVPKQAIVFVPTRQVVTGRGCRMEMDVPDGTA